MADENTTDDIQSNGTKPTYEEVIKPYCMTDERTQRSFKPEWECLSESEIEDFFKKYLALWGLEGGFFDYHQIKDWGLGRGGPYPRCFQKIWPMPIGKMYGNIRREAEEAYMKMTFPNTYLAAISSYRKYLAGLSDTTQN